LPILDGRTTFQLITPSLLHHGGPPAIKTPSQCHH
jgi:hypothetical protein